MPACIITLLDEVNCKIKGLEPSTIRKCVNALKFIIPHARHTPAFKAGRWDGKVGFFSVGGGTQINMLEKYIIPILEDEQYEIEIDDQRTPFDFTILPINENIISDRKWPADHPTNPNEPIILKPHQVDVINNFLANPQGIQVAPTSAGKTIITGTLCRLVEHLGRTITIVPNKQLVTQTYQDFKLLGLDVGVYFGDQKDWHKQHTICTWQSLEILQKATKKGQREEDSDMHAMAKDVVAIIVDEAHSSKADVLRALLTRVFNKIPVRWGLTGTMPKEEYVALSIVGSIGKVINTITASELQELGVLSKCEIHVIQLQEDKKFRTYHDEHDYLVNDTARVELLSRFIENIGATGNTLVLVQNISIGKKLVKLLPESVFISGGVDVDDRNEEYKEIATADNKIIIATYGVASTGINVPRIFNMILIEPGKSFIRTIQSIGRGLRRAHDKDSANIYDVCSSTKYSKRHLTERKKYYKEAGYPFQVIKVDPEEL
jgi:superfamily II DNA or RNA helicase